MKAWPRSGPEDLEAAPSREMAKRFRSRGDAVTAPERGSVGARDLRADRPGWALWRGGSAITAQFRLTHFPRLMNCARGLQGHEIRYTTGLATPMASHTDETPGSDGTTLEERRFAQDALSRTRELDLKEREIAAKEREVTSKEREVASKEDELRRSRWLNPIVVGLLAATVGLLGNMGVAYLNNQNSQHLEHIHAQSSLMLEIIKAQTPEAACKNMTFFVGLGLLDDADKTVRNQCASDPEQAPFIPTYIPSPSQAQAGGRGFNVVDEAGKPIVGAKVSATPGDWENTDQDGFCLLSTSPDSRIHVEKEGYLSIDAVYAGPERNIRIVMKKKR